MHLITIHREGICGSCGAMVNGVAHGPVRGVTLCQLHMRSFNDGDTIILEPFRAKSLPVIQDLVVDRSAFDPGVTKRWCISVKQVVPLKPMIRQFKKTKRIYHLRPLHALDVSACVAACPNASASLFVSAKVSVLALLPQGSAERKRIG